MTMELSTQQYKPSRYLACISFITCLSNECISQLIDVINEDLKLVEKWLNDCKLSLIILKTHSLLISAKPKLKALESSHESLKLEIRENELEAVPKIKYLCVQIDNALDVKEHIKTVFKACNVPPTRANS